MSPELARQFVAAMTEGPGKVEIRFDGHGRCDCGCGRPARVEMSIGPLTAYIDDPIALDAIIDVLAEMRGQLWGPGPVKRTPENRHRGGDNVGDCDKAP